jgi:hypothetical protein
MKFFWERRRQEWELGKVEFPWDKRPSIYSHIQQHIRLGQRGLTEGGERLPDEALQSAEGGLRWVAGGLDGAFGHHGGGSHAKARAKQINRALRVVVGDVTASKLSTLYQLLLQGSALEFVDPLLEQLIATPDLDVERLRALALWIAKNAPDREPVKVAIAILGVVPDQGGSLREALMTLGRHEEFTLYAAVALANSPQDCERRLFELAQHVDGWGRIQVVERLSKTTDPEIRRWLLREGYKNSIMYEYLAYTCATTGELLRELSGDAIDDELLTSTGDIIQALIAGGPAQGIDDYADGALVVDRYLQHLGPLPSKLEQLVIVNAIKHFLDEDVDWTSREANGWTNDRRTKLRAQCQAIEALPHWREAVIAGLEAQDRREFATADHAARVIGIDTWTKHYQRLVSGQDDEWYFVMQTKDPERIDKVIALAEQRIPLEKIATGPGRELGVGPEWSDHSHLDFVLQDLRRFPGKGWLLIRAGLRSPVVRNRHMALRALSSWGTDRWSSDTEMSLRNALNAEPDEEVRAEIKTVLAGDEIEEPRLHA